MKINRRRSAFSLYNFHRLLKTTMKLNKKKGNKSNLCYNFQLIFSLLTRWEGTGDRERERDVLIQKDVQMADLLLSHFLNVIVLYTTLQIQKYFSLRVRVGYEATSAHISHSAPTSIRNSTLWINEKLQRGGRGRIPWSDLVWSDLRSVLVWSSLSMPIRSQKKNNPVV